MKRQILVLCVLLSAAPVAAQAQTVPTIPFESVPNPLKLPNDIHLGEVAGIAVNSKGNSSCSPATDGHPHGTLRRSAARIRSGREVHLRSEKLYAWSFAHAVRTTDRTTSGRGQRPDMILKFNPEGARVGAQRARLYHQVPPTAPHASGLSARRSW